MHAEQSASRLLIIEDSGFIADALAQLTQLLPTIRVVGHADNHEDALKLASTCLPTMVSLDLRICAKSGSAAHTDHGLATLRNLREMLPVLPILIVTALPEQPWLRITAQLGAVGFVSKERSSAEILAALQAVAAGMLAFTPAQMSLLRGTRMTLSPREHAVLNLLAEGCSNAEIAGVLQISAGTVRKHVENLYAALNAHTRTQAIAVARHQGLLE